MKLNQILSKITFRNGLFAIVAVAFLGIYVYTDLHAKGSPRDKLTRINAIKKYPSIDGKESINKTWKFKNTYGKIKFEYKGTTGRCYFYPNNKVDGPWGFLQVARSGDENNWYTFEKEINMLSNNKKNFVLRTEPVYGFRVDRTKCENTPFFDQAVILKGTTLKNYKIKLNSSHLSDGPRVDSSLMRLVKINPDQKMYRLHFLISIMNIESGQIYAVVEWGIEARLEGPSDVKNYLFEPSLVTKKIPELDGRDLAMNRWNTIYARDFVRESLGNTKESLYKNQMENVIYPIPGHDQWWGDIKGNE
ncbi:MAG: hypothetical protein GY754_15725 [bacterium]|nr:hypothetical protein [bacterium]